MIIGLDKEKYFLQHSIFPDERKFSTRNRKQHSQLQKWEDGSVENSTETAFPRFGAQMMDHVRKRREVGLQVPARI